MAEETTERVYKHAPKCPDCEVVGMEHIRRMDSDQASRNGVAAFEVVYCDSCGHVFGVLPTRVIAMDSPVPPLRTGL